MFSLEDLDKDLFVCQIYCVWICFGSVCALSPNCTGSLPFFFCRRGLSSAVTYGAPEPLRHLWFPPNRWVRFLELNIFCTFLSLWPPPVAILGHPSMSAALIFSWVGFDFPFTITPKKKRGIAVRSHMWKLQRCHCGLAAASCGAVYRAPHSIFAGWVSAFCHSHIHYLWWGPVMVLTIIQRLLMVLVWTP